MYYAFSVRWGEDISVNAKAASLDREGRVPFTLVPLDANLPPDQLRQLIVHTVSNYKATPGQSYAEFTSGDKVAAIGAVGLLASMLGVKYGKAASAGIALVVLAFLKKAWFLIAFPFLWLIKKLRKPKG